MPPSPLLDEAGQVSATSCPGTRSAAWWAVVFVLMAHLLGAENLALEFPTKTVFDSVTLGIQEGDRIGIVGRNGDGKSSLLAMVAGHLQPDSGRVTLRGGVRVGVLGQSDTLNEELTVAACVIGSRAEHDWAGDPKIRSVVSGLLGEVGWDESIANLSGGQRRRVSLAQLLVGEYDILALDEPTNHLDVEAIAWLADHLNSRWTRTSGALLVVTHDRWFLDEVCTTTWEVHDRTVEPFEGGYAAYILQRVERDRQAAAAEQRRQNLARKELAWLRRGPPARTSKPKLRIDAANALIADVPQLRDRVTLESLAVSRLGKQVVDLLDVSVSYGDRKVLRDVEWRIAPGERTGILGANGVGKSTLLSLISGHLLPTQGRVKTGKTVKVRELTQQMAELDDIAEDPVRTVVARLRTTYEFGVGSKTQELSPSQLLERLGFETAQLSTTVKDLSGGQQRRLQLLLVLLEQPNVLILDEPTNDLDTDMLTALEDLLDGWPGTLLVVSHDRYFLERVTDQQYAIVDGRLRHLPGGVDEYLRIPKGTAVSAADDRPSSKSGRSQVTNTTGLTSAQRRAVAKEIGAIERRLTKLHNQVDRQREALVDIDQSDYAPLAERTAEIKRVEDEIGELETAWLELGESLDPA